MSTSILLVGESGSGKTHFGAQLLGRLQARDGKLRMNGAAPSLDAFAAALERMNEGLEAAHTPEATNHDSEWPVLDAEGRSAELYWPDYGGEQIKRILEQRTIPEIWRDRAAASEAWIILLRLGQPLERDDIFSRPLADLRGQRKPPTDFRMSRQARAIELLQMLLFARGAGVLRPLKAPRLMVLLSCWDELQLGEGALPMATLLKRGPLFADFVHSNWAPGCMSVMGLSALERPLTQEKADQEYIDQGPEAFGFVVEVEGQRSKDLTLPIANLIK